MRALPTLTATLAAASLVASGVGFTPAAQAAPAPAAVPAARRADTSPSTLTARLDAGAKSRYLGSGFSGVVVDGGDGRTLWSRNTTRTRMPASTQKVLTAYTVLNSMPADTELITRTLMSPTVRGNVYLKGAGDPSLEPFKLKTLASRTALALKRQGITSVRLYADASIFPSPTNATGWKPSYISAGEVQPVRGLTLRRYRGGNGTTAAGTTFATYLTAAGVSTRYVGTGVTPARPVELSASYSLPVSTLVQQMLSVSDNDYAEYLLRIAAVKAGKYPTWSNSLANQRRALSEGRIPLSGYVNRDGSGLSRANRMPVRTLAATVERLWDDPATHDIVFAYGAMPRSGQTGTLRSRYKATGQRCAVGRVLAKTGTLGDAVALAGVARGADGRDRVFAFIQNGNTATSKVRSAVDSMATAVVGCN